MISHHRSDYPPSYSIVRENKIEINSDKFKEFIEQLNNLNAKSEKFINAMNRIRLAVQSNLGLSEVDRDAHETYQPVWVKKGKPNLNSTKVIYDHAPEVQIIDDQADDDGFSIIFQTKYRQFSLHINNDGNVTSSLELMWEEIFNSLSPNTAESQASFRSFTPWQRYSESNFFNGRSTSKVLSYLSQGFPEIFSYDSKSYYRDNQSENIDVNYENIAKVNSNHGNLYLQIDHSLLHFDENIERQTLLAVVKRKSPLMGYIIQLVPVIHENGKFHLVLHGHQQETIIEKIIACDFELSTVTHLKWVNEPIVINGDNGVNASK